MSKKKIQQRRVPDFYSQICAFDDIGDLRLSEVIDNLIFNAPGFTEAMKIDDELNAIVTKDVDHEEGCRRENLLMDYYQESAHAGFNVGFMMGQQSAMATMMQIQPATIAASAIAAKVQN